MKPYRRIIVQWILPILYVVIGATLGICGELGADPTLTETFLRMGIDELSVNAKSVLPLRKIIRSTDLSK